MRKTHRLNEAKRLVAYLLLLVTLFVTGRALPAHALPPFTQKDLDRIYITEHYRDEGVNKQYGCKVGGFIDPGANAKFVWDFFAQKGYSEVAIAGMIGNMHAESGVLFQVLEGKPGVITPAESLGSGDKSKGWGIVQWTPATKFINTFSTVTDANLPQNQLDFLWKQLEGTGELPETAAGNALKAATTVEEATRLFATLYERPAADKLAASLPDRLAAAEGAMERFGGSETTDETIIGAEGGGDGTISSCSAATENPGSAAAAAQEQVITGGANFKRDVPGGNAADFVSWAFKQAGNPFTTGTDGWRISSATAMQQFFANTPGYVFIPAGSQPPQVGDVAFYIDPATGTEYVDIVIAVNGDQMTVVGLNSNGDVTQSVKSTQPGANGLIGFGRGTTSSTSGGGSAPSGPVSANYGENLALIKGVTTYRNTNQDNSPYKSIASANLPIDSLLGPRSEYLGNPAGNPEQDFPTPEGGQNRTGCEFSHFAYDDPLVYPGIPGKSHLHMFFGNTDINAYSTYDTVINSGSSTCNGMELNRTGYWVPAMFDGQGNVRIPERIVVYYKGEGLARGNAKPYPENAAMIANLTGDVNAISPGQGGAAGKYSFQCSNQYSAPQGPDSNTIPPCDGSMYVKAYGDTAQRVVLEMNVKFPMCWTGSNPEDYKNSWRIPTEGSWYFSLCNGSHPSTHPNLEYFVNYHVMHGENTADWYLSSDVGRDTLVKDKPSGSTVHGDWWGGWNKEINQRWIDNCVNFRDPGGAPSGCGFGYLTNGGPDGNNPYPGPALKYRKQYTGTEKVPAQQVYQDLCRGGRAYSGPQSAAYCDPNATAPPPTTGGGTGTGAGGGGGSPNAPTASCDGAPQQNVAPPGSNLPSLVSGAAEGTCFVLQSGTYSFGNVRPKNNMKFIGASKTGTVVNGNGYENAFSGNASNVVIGSMTFQNFNNSGGQKAQEQAPIRGTTGLWQTDPSNIASNWLIDNISSHDNFASGIFLGNNFTVRGSEFYNNGVTGIGGTRFNGGLIEGNNIYNNGGSAASGLAENGGNIKLTYVVGSSQLTIRSNSVHDGQNGVWFDLNSSNILVENNTISNHYAFGVFFEVSKNGTVRGNTITNSSGWSGWGGEFNNGSIGVGESTNILIEGNTINGGESAVTVRQTRRPWPGEEFMYNIPGLNTTTSNVTVRNNTVNGSKNIGASHGPSGAGILQYGSITFSGNTYSNPGGMRFWWNGSSQDYNAWRNAGRQ